jgi:peptidylprolyl isomerase
MVGSSSSHHRKPAGRCQAFGWAELNSEAISSAATLDRLQGAGRNRFATTMVIMLVIHTACAAVALALIAAATPIGPAGAATNQVIEMPNGLKYTDSETGAGAEATAGHEVSVHYTGWLSDSGAKGKKFDSSVDRGQSFQFTLGAHQVIAGWDEGVAGMKVGGKRTLIIPPELGYGARGAGGVIPPNATLIFDVELLGVQ